MHHVPGRSWISIGNIYGSWHRSQSSHSWYSYVQCSQYGLWQCWHFHLFDVLNAPIEDTSPVMVWKTKFIRQVFDRHKIFGVSMNKFRILSILFESRSCSHTLGYVIESCRSQHLDEFSFFARCLALSNLTPWIYLFYLLLCTDLSLSNPFASTNMQHLLHSCIVRHRRRRPKDGCYERIKHCVVRTLA